MTGIEMHNNIRREELLQAAEVRRQQKRLLNEARAYAKARAEQATTEASKADAQPVQNRRNIQTSTPKPILSPAGEM